MTKSFQDEKGLGVLGIILLIVVVLALLNVYAYFNPAFSLSKYSPVNYLKVKQDDERVKDLAELEKAVLAYYEENSEIPTRDGWCGRISGVLHPEFRSAVENYFPNAEPPQDPLRGGTEKDYFYYRVDRSTYVLMAILDIPRDQGIPSEKYNFTGCHDWPGDGFYNYQLSNIEN